MHYKEMSDEKLIERVSEILMSIHKRNLSGYNKSNNRNNRGKEHVYCANLIIIKNDNYGRVTNSNGSDPPEDPYYNFKAIFDRDSSDNHFMKKLLKLIKEFIQTNFRISIENVNSYSERINVILRTYKSFNIDSEQIIDIFRAVNMFIIQNKIEIKGIMDYIDIAEFIFSFIKRFLSGSHLNGRKISVNKIYLENKTFFEKMATTFKDLMQQ
ncbi:hypothetical protein DMUE_0676 [Dictyocoela muelleri]|nr:hypothetical protein DMUE_0676 [Dictyocoela muelleri]